MLVATYKTKKSLKEHIGQSLCFIETSRFNDEYKSSGTFTVVGPAAYDRRWYATVTMKNGLIASVK